MEGKRARGRPKRITIESESEKEVLEKRKPGRPPK
jgi:hypothetical protein